MTLRLGHALKAGLGGPNYCLPMKRQYQSYPIVLWGAVRHSLARTTCARFAPTSQQAQPRVQSIHNLRLSSQAYKCAQACKVL